MGDERKDGQGKLTEDKHRELNNSGIWYYKPESKFTKTDIIPIGHKHYFRKLNPIITASSYAHLAMEIDFSMMMETLQQVCKCPEKITTLRNKYSKTNTTDYMSRMYMSQLPLTILKGNSWDNIDLWTVTIKRRCTSSKNDINNLKSSFAIIDTAVRKNKMRSMRNKRAFPIVPVVLSGAIAGITGGMLGGYMGSPNWDMDAIVQDIYTNEMELNELKKQRWTIQEDINRLNRNFQKTENFILLSSMLNVC